MNDYRIESQKNDRFFQNFKALHSDESRFHSETYQNKIKEWADDWNFDCYRIIETSDKDVKLSLIQIMQENTYEDSDYYD